MSKQDIIREGIAHWIQDEADNGYLRHWDEMTDILSLDQQWDYFLGIADLIMADESKIGVVIKVDSPTVKATANTRFSFEGYGAFEPLVDE